MKLLIGIMAMLLPVLSYGQASNLQPLTIGDSVPEVHFTSIVNYKAPAANLTAFTPKLVILDFWSSWCGSCINLFPRLDSLQRQFKNDVQIILVNTKSIQYKDDSQKIKAILARVRRNTGVSISMPLVYNCPQLDSYFPCISIPHEVWIYKQKVVGITFPEAVTPANIRALLDGRKVHMRLKQDKFDVNIRKPLFINGNAGNGDETIYRSLIAGYIDGVAGGTGIRQENGSVTGMYAVNQTLYSLVKTAYGREIPFVDNRVVFDVKNKKAFSISYTDTAAYHFEYSYDLMLPPANDTLLFLYMQNDLRRFFNISVKREKRKIKCLVLTGSAAYPINNLHADTAIDLGYYAQRKYIRNYPAAEVVRLLNIYSAVPILNETNTAANICIDLPRNINDTKKLRQAFAATGLRLTEEERNLEVVVVGDR